MTRSVDELNIKNWNVTGQDVPFPQYEFDLEIKWTADDGTKHVHGPQTYTFPNDLGPMPLSVRRRFVEEMIVAVARVTLGIDDWEQYS